MKTWPEPLHVSGAPIWEYDPMMLNRSLALCVFVACSPSPAAPDGGGTDASNDVTQQGDASDNCEKTCGITGDQSCCSVAAVAGGTFLRDYDGVLDGGTLYVDNTHMATLSPFTLDVYPVTIGRFRKFLAAYPGNLPQQDGLGKNPNNPDDPGWSMSWNALMPPTSAAVGTAISFNSLQWKAGEADGGYSDYPIASVTWYEAFAFCIWDGGRLPSSAEYNYAQSGGSEQRYFPWSNPPSSTVVDSTLDVYNAGAMVPVGTTPLGNGKYGQADLSGNAFQWVLDTNSTTNSEIPGLPTTCNDCALFDAGPNRAFRGASYQAGETGLRSALNLSFKPDTRGFTVGFRCARN